MNSLRKLYCRAVQKVFRAALPILPYTSPKILKSCTEAAGLLREKGKDRVLIVCDEFIHNSGLMRPLEDSLKSGNIEYYIYDKTVANPTISNVEEARSLYIEKNCNALIGFGGGSSIDAAKAVGARIARPKKSISRMEGIIKILCPTPYTIAIPTTAGTGSEVTATTVITDDKTQHKFPISDFVLIPNACVLDSDNTASLPPNLTATTGMDALTHAIEAYIGGSTTVSTRRDSIEAIELISSNLEKAYADGGNKTARENMLKAAFLAGRAFSKSYVGYCHSVAHSLGGKYHIPHGLANAVLLPIVLEEYGESIYKKSKAIAIAMGIADESTSEKQSARLVIDKIKEMNKNMEIPKKLSGIKARDIAELASYADREANPLYPVPKLMDKNELEIIYKKAMEE